jgi:hypothetical protein
MPEHDGSENHSFVNRLRQVYRASTRHYPTTPVNQPIMEERELWTSNLNLTTQDLAGPALDFVEPPDHAATLQCTEHFAFRSDSQLQFFMDAAQDTRVLWGAGTIPVAVCSPVAVILQRLSPGGELRVWAVRSAQEPIVLLPRARESDALWQAFDDTGLTPMDTVNWEGLPARYRGAYSAELMQSFQNLRLFAYVRSLSIRHNYEQSLLTEWADMESEGWLVVDGNVTSLTTPPASRVIGVVKSHRQEYFRGDAQALLMLMPPLHRTNAFSLRRGIGGEESPMSWYLRWKPSAPPHPDFGLLRVECPRILSSADIGLISAWIIAEARPNVQGRDGNVLYPIAECERIAKRIIEASRRQWYGRWGNT